MADIATIDVFLRLVAAVVCGGVIGLERDVRNMPTGLRTLSLVCLGSCVAVIAALKAGGPDEFSRIAQGLVTGIGFLGGGVILQKERVSDIKGLTTAAAIWMTAALGLLCGIGEFTLAFLATALATAILLLDVTLHPLGGVKKSESRWGAEDSDRSGR